jgi:uncharacterized coiled-coil DUF342 family protein
MRLGSLPALLVLFSLPQIPGCDTSKIQETLKKVTYENADSILTKSQSNIVVLGRVSEKSDSVITEKVTKTTEKIENLTHEIKVLKKENNELKKKLNTNSDDAVDQHFGLLPISTEPASE